jgi:hypothetical protein
MPLPAPRFCVFTDYSKNARHGIEIFAVDLHTGLAAILPFACPSDFTSREPSGLWICGFAPQLKYEIINWELWYKQYKEIIKNK